MMPIKKKSPKIDAAVFDLDSSNKSRVVKIGAHSIISNLKEESSAVQEFIQKAADYNTEFSVKITDNKFQSVKEDFMGRNVLLAEAIGNSAIQPCIEAYQTNIAYPDRFIKAKSKLNTKENDIEKTRLENLILVPNPVQTFQDILENCVYDACATGVYYLEVVRNIKNEIIRYYHIPAGQVTKVKVNDEKPVLVTYKNYGANDQILEAKIKRDFDFYIIKKGNKQRFCKTFTDPRCISSKDGKIISDVSVGLTLADFNKSATEIIEVADYYGFEDMIVPPWMSQISFVKGLRKAQAVNLDFFENNGIPAMIVTVAGGSIDEEYIGKLKNVFEGQKGIKANTRVVVLEAQSSLRGNQSGMATGVNQPNINLHDLMASRNNDLVFKEFLDVARQSIQSSFRITDIIVGRNTDYTQSTAETAFLVCESQVFEPYRKKLDNVFNTKVFQDIDGLPPKDWKMVSSPPQIILSIKQKQSLEALTKGGATTPNMTIEASNDIYGTNTPKIEGAWADYPQEILKAFATESAKRGESIDSFMGSLTPIQEGNQ